MFTLFRVIMNTRFFLISSQSWFHYKIANIIAMITDYTPAFHSVYPNQHGKGYTS